MARKKKINSRDKGVRGELDWAHWLQEHGVEARRGRQFHGGPDSPDVVTNLPFIHFETKYTERLSLYEAYAQAVRDAPENTIPVVNHRRNHKDWLIIMSAKDFMKFRLRMEYRVDPKKVKQ